MGWLSVADAPFDDPQSALAVIEEQGGFGAYSAAPIARKIMEAAFNIDQPPTSGVKVYKPDMAL